jgi:hypothetical protein
VTAAGPAGDPVRASFARRGEVTVVELAGVCGLARLPVGRCSSRAAPSDLEPDLERCRAEAARLLRRIGQMIARERLAEVVTGA